MRQGGQKVNNQSDKENETGIYLADYIGIGDKLQFGCLPENFYRNTGRKLVDLNNSYVFDYNPYVSRETVGLNNIETVDLWKADWPSSSECLSKSERWCKYFDLETCFLRHPRVYIHENLPTEDKLITVHTAGKTKGTFTNEIIGYINKNYRGYNIVQIGGKNDKETPFIDKRGLGFFQSAEIIARSQIFIGPSSAMYHLSRCYPRVRKKVVILDQDDTIDREKLKTFIPYQNGYDDWLDFDTELYSESDHDIGVTRTFRKI